MSDAVEYLPAAKRPAPDSLAGMVRCARRELRIRMELYPGRVKKGFFKAEDAQWEQRAMLAIVNWLERAETAQQEIESESAREWIPGLKPMGEGKGQVHHGGTEDTEEAGMRNG